MLYYHYCNNKNDPTPEKIAKLLGWGYSWKGTLWMSFIGEEKIVIRGWNETAHESYTSIAPYNNWWNAEAWVYFSSSLPSFEGELKFAPGKQHPGKFPYEKNLWEKPKNFLLLPARRSLIA